MPWRDWSDFKRAQVVNALIVVFFLVAAWLTWRMGAWPWPWLFLAGALFNTIGGVWRARRGGGGS